jgi:hypothetical protein
MTFAQNVVLRCLLNANDRSSAFVPDVPYSKESTRFGCAGMPEALPVSLVPFRDRHEAGDATREPSAWLRGVILRS